MAKRKSNRKSEKAPETEIVQGQPEAIVNSLDPGLQQIILRRRSGHEMDQTFTEPLADGKVVILLVA